MRILNYAKTFLNAGTDAALIGDVEALVKKVCQHVAQLPRLDLSLIGF